MIKLWSFGKRVENIQKLLIWEWLLKSIYVNDKWEETSSLDGKFWVLSERAVKDFQIKYWLSPVDWIVWNDFLNKLLEIQEDEEDFNESIEELDEMRDIIKDIYDKNPELRWYIEFVAKHNKRESLEVEQLINRKTFNVKTDTKTNKNFLLKELKIGTWNDNWVNLDWEFFWEDTWKTFTFDLDWKIIFSWDEYKVNANLSEYTTGEIYYGGFITKDSFKNATRIDTLHLDAQKLMSNESFSWLNVKWYLGWWLDWIWDFWLEEVQTEWHELNNFYTNKSKQEDMFWVSPTINWSVEFEKTLVWDNELWMYAFWDINAQLALISRYWSSNVSSTAWLWTNYWRFWVAVSHTLWYEKLPWGSKTINNSWLSWGYNSTNVEITAAIPLLKNSSISYNLSKWWKQDYMSLNYIYKFAN